MNSCILTDACLDECVFVESDLRNLKYGRYPDFLGHKNFILCIAFSSDDKYLATGSDDNTIKLWSVASQKEINTLHRHSK